MTFYRYLPDSTDYEVDGILRTGDKAHLVPDATSGAWQQFLEWAATNTPLPAQGATIAQERLFAKDAIDEGAEEAYSRLANIRRRRVGGGVAILERAAYEEALRILKDADPEPAEYPYLEQLVGLRGGNLTDVATSVRAEWQDDAIMAGQVEVTRQQAWSDVETAADIPAVRAVVTALSWPV